MRRALLLSAALAALAVPFAAAAQSPPTLRIETETPSAPKGDGTTEHFFTITLKEGTTAYKLDRVFVKSWSTSGDADAPPPRGGGRNELAMEDTAGKEKAPARKDMALKGQTIKENLQPYGGFAGGVRVATGDVDGSSIGANQALTVGGARTESVRPLQKGSVSVQVSSPWAACRVGTRYPSLELAGGGKSYVLRDVTVSSCGTAISPDEVAFSYQAIKFVY